MGDQHAFQKKNMLGQKTSDQKDVNSYIILPYPEGI